MLACHDIIKENIHRHVEILMKKASIEVIDTQINLLRDIRSKVIDACDESMLLESVSFPKLTENYNDYYEYFAHTIGLGTSPSSVFRYPGVDMIVHPEYDDESQGIIRVLRIKRKFLRDEIKTLKEFVSNDKLLLDGIRVHGKDRWENMPARFKEIKPQIQKSLIRSGEWEKWLNCKCDTCKYYPVKQ